MQGDADLKFLLHIGSPKAGSSFLQTLCARSRTRLADSGIYFPPGTPHNEACMLAGRISAGNAQSLALHIREQQWDRVEQWLRRVAEAAVRKRCDRILLSSEWLLGSLAGDDHLIELSRRLDRLGGHSLEFLLVLRDPVGQLLSLYKHRAKSGSLGSIDQWVQGGYDLPRRLAGIRRQIDASGVVFVVRSYSKQSASLERVFFEDWLGIPVPENTANLLVNPSLSLSELVLLRKLRAQHPGLVPYLYERLLALEPGVKVEGQAMQAHALQVATNTVAVHAQEWQHWNALLPEVERFSVPAPGPDPGPEPASLELSAAQLGVLMELLSDAVGMKLRLQLLWSWRLRPLLSRIKHLVWPGGSRRSVVPGTELIPNAGLAVELPEPISELRLAEAARQPLPVIGTKARILLLCARESVDELQAELLGRLCGEVQDWPRLLQQAEFRMILPLVYRHLSSLSGHVVPTEILADLKARTRRIAMQNLAMTAVHHRLMRDVIEPLNLPYLFFKGPSLAYRFYREPGLRQFRDIDLLIPRRHMVVVGQRLREVGFRIQGDPAWATDDGLKFRQRFSGMMNWISPEGVLVEMPTSLDDWDRLPTDEVIAAAESVDMAGLRVRTLPSADFFCYLCKHHSRHHWARLHWIADLNAITAHPDFDLEKALEQARIRGFERIVKAACAIREAAALPEPWTADFSDPFAHELFRCCLINQENDFEQELALRTSFPATSIDVGLAQRRRRHWLYRNLSRFQPRESDYLHWPLKARWHSLYYFLRPFLYLSRRHGDAASPD